MVSKAIKSIYSTAHASKGSDGTAELQVVQVAKLIRARLKSLYPSAKFTVKKTGYDTIWVSWENGPSANDVGVEVGQYRFGGFDGSIDMTYETKNWLLPDGTMKPAGSPGTVGSGGFVDSFVTDCPVPGAILVKHGPKHVHISRSISDNAMRLTCEEIAAEHGYEITCDPLHQQVVAGDYLTTLANQRLFNTEII